MRRFTRSFVAFLLALAPGCTAARAVVYSGHPTTTLMSDAGVPALRGARPSVDANRHVVLISVDGLRPDAIRRFGASTMARLLEEGSFSLAAETITPSSTLPSHTSMLTGAPPEVHGITWNDNRVAEHGRVPVPTIFRAARDHGLTTAAFASKGKFNHLFSPESLDHYVVPEGNGGWSSARTAENVVRYLAEHRPNLLFVHLPEPDRYGHIFGWMSYFYGIAVRDADTAIGTILAAADREFGEGNYTVILTADHGGEGRRHSDSQPLDRAIPWIAWGRGVVAGELPDGIRTLDTAATALWLLGVDAPETVAGSPIRSAFDARVLALDTRDTTSTYLSDGAPGSAIGGTAVPPDAPAVSEEGALSLP